MCDCYDDGEYLQACHESYPIARKQHKCCECGSTIDTGEKYERIKGLWEGEWVEFKTCMICSDIRNAASKDGVCISFGCLYDTVGSEYDHIIKEMSNENT